MHAKARFERCCPRRVGVWSDALRKKKRFDKQLCSSMHARIIIMHSRLSVSPARRAARRCLLGRRGCAKMEEPQTKWRNANDSVSSPSARGENNDAAPRGAPPQRTRIKLPVVQHRSVHELKFVESRSANLEEQNAAPRDGRRGSAGGVARFGARHHPRQNGKVRERDDRGAAVRTVQRVRAFGNGRDQVLCLALSQAVPKHDRPAAGFGREQPLGGRARGARPAGEREHVEPLPIKTSVENNTSL